MNNNIYILIMAVTSFAIRVIPMTLIRRPIKSRFIKSFLYYEPYVTLAVMTFPAIMEATESPLAGIIALIAGIIMAWFELGLLPVAVGCCTFVFIIQLLSSII